MMCFATTFDFIFDPMQNGASSYGAYLDNVRKKCQQLHYGGKIHYSDFSSYTMECPYYYCAKTGEYACECKSIVGCRISDEPFLAATEGTTFANNNDVVPSAFFEKIQMNRYQENSLILIYDRKSSSQGFVGLVQADKTPLFNSNELIDHAANIICRMNNKKRGHKHDSSGYQCFSGQHNMYKSKYSNFVPRIASKKQSQDFDNQRKRAIESVNNSFRKLLRPLDTTSTNMETLGWYNHAIGMYHDYLFGRRSRKIMNGSVKNALCKCLENGLLTVNYEAVVHKYEKDKCHMTHCVWAMPKSNKQCTAGFGIGSIIVELSEVTRIDFMASNIHHFTPQPLYTSQLPKEFFSNMNLLSAKSKRHIIINALKESIIAWGGWKHD